MGRTFDRAGRHVFSRLCPFVETRRNRLAMDPPDLRHRVDTILDTIETLEGRHCQTLTDLSQVHAVFVERRIRSVYVEARFAGNDLLVRV
jgi:hypothetical protein